MKIEKIRGNENVTQIKNLVNDALYPAILFYGKENQELIKNAIESTYFYHWNINQTREEVFEDLFGALLPKSVSKNLECLDESIPQFHLAQYDSYRHKVNSIVVYKQIQNDSHAIDFFHETFGHAVCGYIQDPIKSKNQIRNGIDCTYYNNGENVNIGNEGFMELVANFIAHKLSIKRNKKINIAYEFSKEVAQCIFDVYNDRETLIQLLLYGKGSIEQIYNYGSTQNEWGILQKTLLKVYGHMIKSLYIVHT